MRFGQRIREDAESIWGEVSRTPSSRRVVRRPTRGHRFSTSESFQGEPGDPRVDWDSWDPEVYSSDFGNGKDRENPT
ncbi:MAG: hypothetical protein IMX00_08435 [Limnochordales bacterium]|nr:hypothetical protein [Limnochordales bacterium]